MVGIGSIWLRIGTGGRLMWTRWWTSGFHKMQGSSRVAAQLAASQEGLSSMSEWGVGIQVYLMSDRSGQQIVILTTTWWWRRIQWPRGLRHEPSSPVRTLGPWFRIPLDAWMSVCVYSVCVVLCVGSGFVTGWAPVQGVQPTVYRIKKLKKRSRSVTVQTCYSSPWKLWSSLVISEGWRFIGEADVLTCYDLFFVSERKTTAWFFLHSVWMTGRGQSHHAKQGRYAIGLCWFHDEYG
jgi:hypothetical protein